MHVLQELVHFDNLSSQIPGSIMPFFIILLRLLLFQKNLSVGLQFATK